MSNLFDKTIQYEVSVVDEQQQPIPYATLWVIYVDSSNEETSIVDMQRLLRRYSKHYDILSAAAVGPISEVLIKRTDAEGYHRMIVEENNFRGLNELPVIVGVLKRGYQPVAYAKTMRVGSKHQIVLQLQKDTVQTYDSRMLALDEIRGEVSHVFPDWTKEQRWSHIDKMNARLLGLARDFEQEGKYQEAAIAYYNLAYLPSIDRIINHEGQEQAIGYTRGYDEKSALRKANLEKAFALGGTLPLLHNEKLQHDFTAQGGRIWVDQSKRPLRLQMITEFEAILASGEEYMLSRDFWLLSRLYSYVGNPVKACEVMRHYYQFEPRAFPSKEWPSLFKMVQSQAREPIKGNPAFPDFVCEMQING